MNWLMLWERLITIIIAPSLVPKMIWILTPMLITLFLMTLYFGRYRKEELGWNTAFGNSLVLVFVGLDLLKLIYPGLNPLRALLIFIRTLLAWDEKTLLALISICILGYGLILLFIDYFHFLPKKIAFFISNGLSINIFAYFGIIFVYSRMNGLNIIPLDWYTFFAFLILFMLLYAFMTLLKALVPHDDLATLIDETPIPKKKIMDKPIVQSVDQIQQQKINSTSQTTINGSKEPELPEFQHL